MLVKIGLCDLVDSTRQQHLVTYDTSLSIKENIEEICKVIEKPPGNYGILIKQRYVTQENVNQIQDGALLMLNYSPEYFATQIFSSKSGLNFITEFTDLCFDPAFISVIVETKNHLQIINEFCKDDLDSHQIKTCLIAITHLLHLKHTSAFNEKCFRKILSFVKEFTDCQSDDHIRYSLSILQKILYMNNSIFLNFKENIIKEIEISKLIKIIEYYPQNPQMHFCVILLVNALVKCCKTEKKRQQICEMNDKKNREIIFKNIIEHQNKMDANIPHELYLYQTYLLSVYEDKYKTPIDKKLFDSVLERNSFNSEYDYKKSEDTRFSVASIISDYSDVTDRLSECEDDNKISLLTKYAFDFFRQHYEKEFNTFCTEITTFSSEIIPSCERITKIVCKNLNIGMNPSRTCNLYQPLIFNPTMAWPFFYEFHSRVIYLFSQTRQQMKAKIQSDFDKIFAVLDKKVELVLMRKPRTMSELGKTFAEISYQTVMEKWQEEYNKELKATLKKNPSVQVLKKRLMLENKKTLYRHRIKILQEGAYFPLYNDKKVVCGDFKMHLSQNENELIYSEQDKQISYFVNDITHLVEGNACIQVRNKIIKEHDKDLAFCIVIKNDTFINFKAENKKTAKYWIDGLNLLLNKANYSTYYDNELADLVEMDLLLQLMELQNVKIPDTAPPIPALPKIVKPTILPKPKTIMRQYSKKKIPQINNKN